MTARLKSGYVLTAEQQEALAEVLAEKDKGERIDQEAKRQAQRTNARVARALSRGVPAAVLAQHLGVSAQRVYQMRDNSR